MSKGFIDRARKSNAYVCTVTSIDAVNEVRKLIRDTLKKGGIVKGFKDGDSFEIRRTPRKNSSDFDVYMYARNRT